MAYSGLTIETAVSSATLDSHCIPAYPEYYSDTTFNAAFIPNAKLLMMSWRAELLLTLSLPDNPICPPLHHTDMAH